MPPSRIDELRRRVQNDPASIAFAQLAEEYRRAGQTDDAVRVCRDGLTRHPGYLSARVTLGRALLDLGQLGEARGEFEFVVAEAPENLAAVRGLAEIFHREGQTAEALTYYERALALSRHDPEIEEIVQQLSRQLGAAASQTSAGLSFEEAHQELLSAAERVPLAAPAPVRTTAAEGSTAPFDFDRLVAALGSPTAPPQFEAAVTGSAAAAPIELPDVADLGPNPFAALEAELRAHDAAPAQKAAPWEPAAVETPVDAPDAAPVAAPMGLQVEGLVPEAPPADLTAPDAPAMFEGLVAAPAAEPERAAVTDTATLPPEATPAVAGEALADTLIADAVDLMQLQPAADAPSAIEALLATPAAAADAVSGGLAEFAATAAPPPADVSVEETAVEASVEPPVPAVPPAATEDVLDDLESWLSTLHDRGSE